MKRVFYASLLVLIPLAMHAQELKNGGDDRIGTDGSLQGHFLLENGNEGFFRIGASYNASLDHPLLKDITNDFEFTYFIKYDKEGNPMEWNGLRGSGSFSYTHTFRGDFTFAGYAYNDVVSEEQSIPLGGAYGFEFLAQYNPASALEKLIPIWNTPASTYSSFSHSVMDPVSGDFFLAGTGYNPMELQQHGVIGEEWERYLYVVRYNHQLELTGVFTAGFSDPVDNEWGNFNNDLILTPDGRGGVMVCGSYDGELSPLIGDEVLPVFPEGGGAFALKLNAELKEEWVLPGSFNGSLVESYMGFTEGIPCPDGSAIVLGTTETGSFNLGDAKLTFTNGSGYSNHFAVKISRDGELIWQRGIYSMMDPYAGKAASKAPPQQRGEASDFPYSSFHLDGKLWKNKILFLTGNFQNESLSVAGRILEKPYAMGAYVMAIHAESGEEIWGYAASSDMLSINGFDVDGSGNASLLGKSGKMKHFEGLGDIEIPALSSDPIFIVGLDHTGRLMWQNNAAMRNVQAYLSADDLEVLDGGQVYASVYQNTSGDLEVGGENVNSATVYTSHLLNMVADNSLGGTLQDADGVPVYPATVRAYKTTPYGAFPMSIAVEVDEEGRYVFPGLYPGDYTLQAVPDRSSFPELVPTYVGGGEAWDDAKYHLLEADTRFSSLYITLSRVRALTSSDGQGRMGGNVSYADSPIAKGTLGIPVSRTAVLLKKKKASKSTLEDDEVIAYLETDEEGNYVIENVPDGDYYLHVDIPGLPMGSTYDITIVGSQVIDGLDFEVGDETIETAGATGLSSKRGVELMKLYPNPGTGLLQVQLPGNGSYLMQVFDAAGSLQLSRTLVAGAGQTQVDLSQLKRGLYFIQLEGPEYSGVSKYVKE